MKILCLTALSVTLELENDKIYYNDNSYDVFLNGKVILKDVKTNVFSLYDLTPDFEYEVICGTQKITFKTLPASEIVSSDSIDNSGNVDVTLHLQKLIDECKENGVVVIEKGKYLFTSLKLKSNITLYLKKDAILSASIKEEDYLEIDGEEIINGQVIQRGTWEGDPWRMKLSLINCFDCENVNVIGQGSIDGNAQLSTWWENFRQKPYARPHIIFLNQSKNITIQGINLFNSPQWTVHPYFCENVKVYDISITNPKISPNTDGINPQCCDGVEIIGVKFSVGDDCIAIKSGKMYIGKKYERPCKNIVIRNCLMQFGHGAIVLGSEMSGGIKDLTVSRCIFFHTDRGLRIKTRRGRGDVAIIDNVKFSNILMENVLTPLVVNMFYFCDPDGKTEYVYNKEPLKVDDKTPYLGKFVFENIKASDVEYAAGYFYGLPERPVNEISILNCEFTYKDDAGQGNPAMMSYAEQCHKDGFIFYNVDTINFKNVSITGQNGNVLKLRGVKKVNYDF